MAAPTKSEQTRELIAKTALRLFRERGYEATTMRAIAAEAGVSVGNAYYYFSSKEELIQLYYEHSQEDHTEACQAILAREREFRARLLGVVRARIDTLQPYKEFAGKFFKYAAEPTSPLSPFSAESAPVREAAVAVYREVVEGSTLKTDAEIRADLPELLWLYSMGVILHWVYDSSPGAAKTYRLVERTVPLIDRLVGLARVPGMRGIVREALSTYRDLRK
ncbi:TetR family transcriptional regulator [Actinoallomurus purpureus]|uniref:TetR/AcrR family transcriptional regulator n=1 Tax=Actinoallomurus purpureus TaxID=478114 RepID=UPI002092735D|nr:TetR family transcriptional regulator [Actinoallomurus purpureus]MCO6007178.1 TetR family transcriptional regulator [Actinoallomurus purpureus]